ncbi:MAG: MBL fold metallo-hydrolase [Candidatus Woesearchaeota archaeon]|nr:MBL fold metallo-hydrolase [Candidatus Woesearchaeota archaeon]
MEMIFHGATKEVGRSCIEVVTGSGTRFLFDAGIKLSEHGTEMPSRVQDVGGLKAIFLSHAHLDHTGYLPALDFQGLKCPIFTSEPTSETSKMLLIDSFGIGRMKHEDLGYKKEDIGKIMSWMRKVKLEKEGSVQDVDFEYFSAGHIPGSASILVETKDLEKKRIVYTGDIKTTETRLLDKAELSTEKLGDIDVMITEATYGDRDHPDREKEEDRLIESIKAAVENRGSVLIPVFAEGRAQEIAMILNKNKIDFGVPVYMDGMSIEATKIIQQHPESVKDIKKLNSAISRMNMVKGRMQREKIMKDRGIFITTSGMLTGGPIMTYLRNSYNDSSTSILLTGFQGEHTNGRLLLDEKSVFIDGWKTKVSCNVEKFDFSAHCGQKELKELMKKISPEEVIVQHGDPEAVDALAEIAESMGFKAHAPEMDERITIK